MKWFWWITGTVAFCAMLYFTALPGPLAVGRDDDTGLSGTYTVNGVDPSNLEYSGTVVIRDGDTADSYLVEWIVTGSIQRGVGVRQGSEFIVDWTTESSATETGSGRSEYVISPDGHMVGTRTVDGVEGAGTEEIFPDA